jgi:hypothetical protein
MYLTSCRASFLFALRWLCILHIYTVYLIRLWHTCQPVHHVDSFAAMIGNHELVRGSPRRSRHSLGNGGHAQT